jgi:carboxymethylenebutenolidase
MTGRVEGMSGKDEASSSHRPVRAFAGEAFFVGPPGGERGPGVLLLHSWWGLTEWFKDLATRLADEGYSVLAPDLLEGRRPENEDEASRALAERSPDDLSGLVLSSARVLQNAALGEGPIAVVGFSMGASLALWLSARLPDTVGSVVAFYGAQSIDFDDADADYQGHFAQDDHLVSEEDRVLTESFLRLGSKSTDFHVYPGTRHWFFEPGEHHEPAAAEQAWQRTLEFLADQFSRSAASSNDSP